jgi:hypothetical protein
MSIRIIKIASCDGCPYFKLDFSNPHQPFYCTKVGKEQTDKVWTDEIPNWCTLEVQE